MPEPLRKLHKLEQAMCEIFANQRHFTTEETKWSLPVKPESNLCLSIQIVAFTCQLLFEFSIWVLNFAIFLQSRQTHCSLKTAVLKLPNNGVFILTSCRRKKMKNSRLTVLVMLSVTLCVQFHNDEY